MAARAQVYPRGAADSVSDAVAIDTGAAPDLECRVCELETENTRLRLLVSELLVANQRLRDLPGLAVQAMASRGAPVGRED